jgi:hypothetical protein
MGRAISTRLCSNIRHSFLTQNRNLEIVTYLDNSTIGLRDAFHVQSDHPMPQEWIGCLNQMTDGYADRDVCEPEDMVRHMLGGRNWTITGIMGLEGIWIWSQ